MIRLSKTRSSSTLTAIDQAVISAGNLAFSVIAAHALSPTYFSYFGILFTIYVIVMGAQKSLISDVVIIRTAKSDSHGLVSGALAISLLVGTSVGIIALLTGYFITSDLGSGVMVFSLVIIPIVFQDTCRYILISKGKAGYTLAGDIILLLLICGGLFLYIHKFPAASDRARLSALLYIWGFGSAISAIFLLALSSERPSLRSISLWRSGPMKLGGTFALDYVSFALVQQVIVFAIVFLGDLSSVGAIRGAQVLLGPVGVLSTGLGTVLLIYLSGVEDDMVKLKSACLLFTLFLGFSCVVVGLLAFLIPENLGVLVLADNWKLAASATPLMAISYALNFAAFSASLGLRARERAGKGVKVRAITLPIALILVPLGVAFGGLYGALLGMVFTSALSAVLWWRMLLLDISTEELQVA